MSEENEKIVVLRQQKNYQFEIDFGNGIESLRSDEPPPLGAGAGPSPSQLLLAAVGNCMSSSLYFALAKFKNDPGGITTTARAEIGRNDAGRLRVLRIALDIRLGAPASAMSHLDRILGQFEEFCTVGQSVRAGIPMDISIHDGNGQRLK